MSHSAKEIRDLLPLYVLEDLDAEEREQVEAALRSDPALNAEVEEWRESLGQMLAESAPESELSSEDLDRLERRLLSAVGDQSQQREQSVRKTTPDPALFRPSGNDRDHDRGRGLWPLALAASLLSLAVALWALWGGVPRGDVERLQEENRVLAQELTSLREALGRNAEEIERVATSLQTFGYPRSEPIVLAGLEDAPTARGAAFYRPSANEALFFAYGLPQVDASSSYQLWYITGEGPVSAGTFEIDSNGEARVAVGELPPTEEIAVWAVTREPAGGSPQPTGPMLIRS